MTARRLQGKTCGGSKHTSPTLPPPGTTRLEQYYKSFVKAQLADIKTAIANSFTSSSRTVALRDGYGNKAEGSTSRKPASKPSAGASARESVKSKSRRSGHEPQST